MYHQTKNCYKKNIFDFGRLIQLKFTTGQYNKDKFNEEIKKNIY